MRTARDVARSCVLLASSSLLACDPGPTPDDAAVIDAPVPDDAALDAAVGPSPDPALIARYCGERDWDATRTATSVGSPSGRMRLGVITGPAEGADFEAGTLEATRIWPEHPTLVRALRLGFEGSGRVRVRLVRAYGRSYPANHLPESNDDMVDVVPPVELDLVDAVSSEPTEIDVSAAAAILEPTIPYLVVYEHLGGADPHLLLEAVPMGEDAQSLLFFPFGSHYLPSGTSFRDAFGVGGDYAVQVVGDAICSLSDDERLMELVGPFEAMGSADTHVIDFDGDGHDDFVASGGTRPVLFVGDGHGAFHPAAVDPFPPEETSGIPYLADLDEDGDIDAFVTEYTSQDSDGDRHLVDGDDCDDTVATIPGAEVMGNGIDDDCDGVADDGTSTLDADSDGVSIAAGDCNDTVAEIHPGATERHDNRDDDCNGQIDDPFVHHVLLNDGSGHLVRVPDATSGVAMHGATVAGAVADYDGDGHLDVFVGHWLHHYPDTPTQLSVLLRGRGDGTFEDVTAAQGLGVTTPRPVYGATFTDYDDDGREDLLASTYQLQDDWLWHQQADGTFVDVAGLTGLAHDATPPPDLVTSRSYPGGHSYGAEFGDLDGDGDLDVFCTNLAHPRTMPWSDPSRILYNSGESGGYVFEDRTATSGYVYNEGDANVHLGDFDLDGDLDLVVTSHYGLHQRVYRQDDGGHFVDVTYELGVRGRTGNAIWFDADEDGDLDLVTADRSAPRLYLSRAVERTGRHWVELRVDQGDGEPLAVGARVTVRASGRTFVREVRLSGGLANRQASRWLHVGLGELTAIESVSVRWPDDTTESFTGVTADGRWQLHRGSGVAMR
ncbi:MAG: FG-GAP-like repeat-containing protein [Sandaracinaceae bacterium]|nr:FG-GAP-like repeat-containing protein [Sandaracinaceae bacterium]